MPSATRIIESEPKTQKNVPNQGATIVFVEHVMRAVTALADRIVVLDHGQVLAEGAVADVMERSEVVIAYLGTRHA